MAPHNTCSFITVGHLLWIAAAQQVRVCRSNAMRHTILCMACTCACMYMQWYVKVPTYCTTADRECISLQQDLSNQHSTESRRHVCIAVVTSPMVALWRCFVTSSCKAALQATARKICQRTHATHDILTLGGLTNNRKGGHLQHSQIALSLSPFPGRMQRSAAFLLPVRSTSGQRTW